MDWPDAVVKKFAVLVVSCDRYKDLWGPFFNLLRRHWPDCPFKVYLLCNHDNPRLPGVETIATGDDVSWSDNLRTGLGMVEEEYVLLFLEDLMLVEGVDTRKVVEVFEWALKADAGCVRMNTSPLPDRLMNSLVGKVSRGTVYRASTVMSVWKKGVLASLLKPGESAWDFEVHGSVRSDLFEGFYGSWKTCFPVVNSVIKSKWRIGAVGRLRSLGVEPDLLRRKVMTPAEAAVFLMKRMRSKLFSLVPAGHRRAVKEFFIRGRYDYGTGAKERGTGAHP